MTNRRNLFRAGGEGRGSDPFVRVSWEKAAKLVAGELKRQGAGDRAASRHRRRDDARQDLPRMRVWEQPEIVHEDD